MQQAQVVRALIKKQGVAGVERTASGLPSWGAAVVQEKPEAPPTAAASRPTNPVGPLRVARVALMAPSHGLQVKALCPPVAGAKASARGFQFSPAFGPGPATAAHVQIALQMDIHDATKALRGLFGHYCRVNGVQGGSSMGCNQFTQLVLDSGLVCRGAQKQRGVARGDIGVTFAAVMASQVDHSGPSAVIPLWKDGSFTHTHVTQSMLHLRIGFQQFLSGILLLATKRYCAAQVSPHSSLEDEGTEPAATVPQVLAASGVVDAASSRGGNFAAVH